MAPAGVILAEMASAAGVIVEHWPAGAADQVNGRAVRMAGLALTELITAELRGDHAQAAQLAADIGDIADTAADIAELAVRLDLAGHGDLLTAAAPAGAGVSARDDAIDAVLDAACRWAGAMEALNEYRRDGWPDDELAALRAGLDERHGAPLLAAVDAYLRPARGEP